MDTNLGDSAFSNGMFAPVQEQLFLVRLAVSYG